MSIIDGPSNTLEFLNFFQEAYASINLATGWLCLEVGDTKLWATVPYTTMKLKASYEIF